MGSRKLLDANFIRSEVKSGDWVYVFDAEEHGKVLRHNLAVMQPEGSLCEVIIKSNDGHQIPFHGLLLAAMSPKLEETILTKHCSTKYKGNGMIIHEEFNSDVIDCLQEYVYTSRVPISLDNLPSLTELAFKYGLDDLAAECTEQEEYFDDETSDEEESSDEVWVVGCGPSSSDVLQKMSAFYQDWKLCQTCLKGGEDYGKIPCHREILAAASPSFQEMLTFTEDDNGQIVLRLEEPIQVLDVLVSYLYTGELCMNKDSAQPLLDIAWKYEIPSIATACCSWLKECITADNVLGIMDIASEYVSQEESTGKKSVSERCGELCHVAHAFVLEHFHDVSVCDEFLELSVEDLIRLINDDNLIVETEESIFYAVMRWLKEDPDDRSNDLSTLLQYIRLEHTPLEFLHEIKQQIHINKDPACLTTVEKAIAMIENRCYEEYPHEEGYPEQFSLLTQTPEQFGDDVPDFGSLFDVPTEYDAVLDPGSDILDPVATDQSVSPLPPEWLKKNGQPDMRRKENRERMLPPGKNFDGSTDRRRRKDPKPDVARKLDFKEVPTTKEGKPDMRFKVNRKSLLRKDGERDMRFKANMQNQPLRKDGNLDMRFKVNKKKAGKSANETRSSQGTDAMGPLTKKGTPDMRFKANKTNKAASSAPAINKGAAGPLTKKGTPDMRYKENKQALGTSSVLSSSSGNTSLGISPDSGHAQTSRSVRFVASGPLKKDGTPDRRYAANKETYGHGSSLFLGSSASSLNSGYSGSRSGSSYGAPGPLKSDGTPDRRYAANKVAYSHGSSSSLGSSASSLNSGYSGSSSGTSYGVPSGRPAAGPLKSDGTPDMRYSANKAAYGSGSSYPSAASGYSGGSGRSSGSGYGGSYSTGGSSCSGPMKSDGTPDMRYSANRR